MSIKEAALSELVVILDGMQWPTNWYNIPPCPTEWQWIMANHRGYMYLYHSAGNLIYEQDFELYKSKLASEQVITNSAGSECEVAVDTIPDNLKEVAAGIFPKHDAVKSPKHYLVMSDIEAIDVIAGSMTKEMFRGYCLGNILKYRLRAGKKDALEQDIGKASEYEALFEKWKQLCRK